MMNYEAGEDFRLLIKKQSLKGSRVRWSEVMFLSVRESYRAQSFTLILCIFSCL